MYEPSLNLVLAGKVHQHETGKDRQQPLSWNQQHDHTGNNQQQAEEIFQHYDEAMQNRMSVTRCSQRLTLVFCKIVFGDQRRDKRDKDQCYQKQESGNSTQPPEQTLLTLYPIPIDHG